MSLISLTPKAAIVTASKELVDELLAMNTRNRTPKSSNIARITSDIESGNFFLTASGIGVSKTGVLLDGQNRLFSIKKAGYPAVQFVLLTGLEDASQRVVDRHAKRSLSDALTMCMNVTVTTHMVALANAIRDFGLAVGKDVPFQFIRAAGRMTDTEVVDFISEYGELAHEVASTSGYVRAPAMACLFVYALHDREKAIAFCRDIHKGVGLHEDHPAYRLRNAINRMKKMNDASGRMELVKLTASAICAHSRGRDVKQLKGSDSWSNAPWKTFFPLDKQEAA